jgi:hypothetical protein
MYIGGGLLGTVLIIALIVYLMRRAWIDSDRSTTADALAELMPWNMNDHSEEAKPELGGILVQILDVEMIEKASYTWRRGWDSNSRVPWRTSGFQDRCIQPLCHLSEFLNQFVMLLKYNPF